MSPSIAIKFLRDGVDSGNFVAMDSVDKDHSLLGMQDSANFFANSFRNHLGFAGRQLTPLVIAVLFSRATINAASVGLSDFAMYRDDGV